MTFQPWTNFSWLKIHFLSISQANMYFFSWGKNFLSWQMDGALDCSFILYLFSLSVKESSYPKSWPRWIRPQHWWQNNMDHRLTFRLLSTLFLHHSLFFNWPQEWITFMEYVVPYLQDQEELLELKDLVRQFKFISLIVSC